MKELFEGLLCFLESVSGDALVAIPGAAIAILLPLAIFLVEREKYPFDKRVIFEKIIWFNSFIFIIVADVVCLVFTGRLFLMLSLILSAVVIVMMIATTIRTFKWVCSFDDTSSLNSYQQEKRLKYLNTLKNEAEIMQTWHLIFASNEIEELNQHGLMDSLLVSIKKIEKNDDDEKMALSMLLDEFSDNLNKFRFARRDFDEIVKYALGYYRYEVDSRKKDMNIIPPYGMKKLLWNLFAIATADKNRHTSYAYSFLSC